MGSTRRDCGQEDLNRRRALGTSCIATWARYKAVSVLGTVVVRRGGIDAVRRRIHDRLYQMISPLPTAISAGGWTFGEPLRASNVYRVLEQAEPGVRCMEDVGSSWRSARLAHQYSRS
jgi:hypothetical protein